MAVATQEVFAHTDALVQIWDIGAAAPARTLLIKSGVVGVTLTNTSDLSSEDEITVGPYTVSRKKPGGVGNDKATAIDATQAAGVAIDGTWEFEDVLNADENNPSGADIAQSAVVYVTSGGAVSLKSAGNTRIGVVNYPATYEKAAGVLPVAIGL